MKSRTYARLPKFRHLLRRRILEKPMKSMTYDRAWSVLNMPCGNAMPLDQPIGGQMKIVRNIMTRRDAKAPEQSTVLTVDFTGATPDLIQEYALQAITVKVQSRFRGKGFTTIPMTYTFVVRDNPIGQRVAAAPQSIEQLWKAMTPEQRTAFIKAQTQGGTV